MKRTTKQHQFAGTRREWVAATVVALLAWVTTPAPAQNPYAGIRGADMPIPTADATCSPVVNGDIYLFGGRTPSYGSLTDTILVYNVASDTWRVADGKMPYAYCGGGSNYTAAFGGKVYISPGLGPTDNGGWGQHNRIIEFDPATETAVERAAFDADTIWRLNLVTVGSYIYCFGASGFGQEYKIWRYDPIADTITHVGWTVALKDSAAILGFDGQVYLFSWRGGPIEVYDPVSNTCQQTASSWSSAWGGPMPWPGPEGLIHILNPRYSPLRCYDPFGDVLSNLGFTYSFHFDGMCHTWDDDTGRVYFFGGYSYPPYTVLAGTYILVPEGRTPPEIQSINGPAGPVCVNTEVDIGASFTDPDAGDTHTAQWDWGDGTAAPGVVDQDANTVSGSHVYTAAGVYTLTLTVMDKTDASDRDVYEFVVVYDPDAGFVTGGGWIDSPAYALLDSSVAGKATFGFVAKYKQGATTPQGNTEFQFQAGDFRFKSSSYDWLVIAGSKAMFKGEGYIDGMGGGFKFLLTAIDGTEDQFRIKIWNPISDDVIYDNKRGEGDDAEPTTIGGGSIVIHKK